MPDEPFLSIDTGTQMPQEKICLKKKFNAIFFLCLLVILLGLGICILGYKNYMLQKQIVDLQLKNQALLEKTDQPLSPTPQISPIKNPDSVNLPNTYKRYTNADWGIEFEYPNEDMSIEESQSKIFIGYRTPQFVPYITIVKNYTVNLDSLKPCKDIYNQNSSYFPCLAPSPLTTKDNQTVNKIDSYSMKNAFIYKGAFENFYRIVQVENKHVELEFYVTPNRFVEASNKTIETFRFTK